MRAAEGSGAADAAGAAASRESAGRGGGGGGERGPGGGGGGERGERKLRGVRRRHEAARYHPRTNYILPHEMGHPVAGINSFHAAKKLHEHYLKITEARKSAGKETF